MRIYFVADEKDQVYAYFYRAISQKGLFVQPDGFNPDTRETYMPRKLIETHFDQKRYFMGRIEYNRALTPAQVDEAELWPEDLMQYALFLAWEMIQKDGNLFALKYYEKVLIDSPECGVHSTVWQFCIVRVFLDAGMTIAEVETTIKEAK